MPTKVVDGVVREMTPEEVSAMEERNRKRQESNRLKYPLKIKQEAERRILEIAPVHVQRNMTAKGVELLEKLVLGGTLTTEELVFRNAAIQKWKDIEMIRAKSNTLEQMDPIPDDYRDDKYWT